MEVHPPDRPIMTWKQFLVHMSTICLGLLIALGLDQTAEYLHHRHQGHQFEEDMRMEAERNLELIAVDHKALHNQAGYYQSCRMALAAARPEGGKWRVELPSPPGPVSLMVFNSPSVAVWTIGKESQLVPFISASRARLFDRLTYQSDLLTVLRAQYIDLVHQQTDEIAIAVGPSVRLDHLNNTPSFLVTAEQRDQLDRIFTQIVTTASESDFRLSRFEEVSQAVADGTPSLEAVRNTMMLHLSSTKGTAEQHY